MADVETAHNIKLKSIPVQWCFWTNKVPELMMAREGQSANILGLHPFLGSHTVFNMHNRKRIHCSTYQTAFLATRAQWCSNHCEPFISIPRNEYTSGLMDGDESNMSFSVFNLDLA